jgi:hypothetical protein
LIEQRPGDELCRAAWRTFVVGSAVCGALALTGCGSGRSGGVTARAAGVAGCTIPVTRDQYDGFQIGVPAGWSLIRLGGALVVSANPQGTVQAVVEPAVLTGSLTPANFFTTVSGQLQKLAATGGNSLTFRSTGSAGGLPQASVAGQAGGAAVSGAARVSLISYPTAHGSQLVVFSAYWAPPCQLSSQASTLAAVADCYQPEPATLYQIAQDQQFTYPIPPGWQPSESQDQLSVADGQNGAANYQLAFATPSEGINDLPSLMRAVLGQDGISVGTVLSTVSAPPATTVTGATQEAQWIEFTGTRHGTQIHGVASVEGTTSPSDTSGAVRWAYARTDLWNSLSGALLQIAGGIQHQFTQDLQEIARLSRQWQNFNRQVEGFDDALNGVDVVRDPATGQTFEAPYASYQDGPDGPGYYTGSPGNEHKLQIITP